MRCYNKNGLNITAASEGEAQWVSAFLNGEGRRLIIVPDGGSPIVVDMPSETVSIYSQDGKSVALAGKLLYQEIAANLVVLPENWRGILSWFQANVVPSDTTTHQKRKAFVTAVLRMGAVDNGVANSVKDTRDKNDAIDWSKYSDEDSCGS